MGCIDHPPIGGRGGNITRPQSIGLRVGLDMEKEMNSNWSPVLTAAVLVWLFPSVANAKMIDPDNVAQICNAAMNLCTDACQRKYENRIGEEGHVSVGNALSKDLCTDRCIELNTACNGGIALGTSGKKSKMNKNELKPKQ